MCKQIVLKDNFLIIQPKSVKIAILDVKIVLLLMFVQNVMKLCTLWMEIVVKENVEMVD